MVRGLPVALTGWSPGQDTWRIRETITRRSRSAAGASGDIHSHSGTQSIQAFLREVFGSLGTRGGSEGSRRKVFTRHSETDGNLRRAVRQGLRRSLRMEAFGRASRRLRRWEGSSGDTCQIPKGLRRRVVRAGGFERFSGGSLKGGLPDGLSKGAFGGSFERVVFANFHGGRLGSLDPRSTAPVGRLVRTGAR